jgi:hypothetical protein
VNENLQALCDPAASDRQGARQTERSARLEVFSRTTAPESLDIATLLFEKKFFGA